MRQTTLASYFTLKRIQPFGDSLLRQLKAQKRTLPEAKDDLLNADSSNSDADLLLVCKRKHTVMVSSDSDDEQDKCQTQQTIPSTSLHTFQLAIFQHYLPNQYSQSRIGSRNGSSACTLIAANICAAIIDGLLRAALDAVVLHPLPSPRPLVHQLITAINKGNAKYD